VNFGSFCCFNTTPPKPSSAASASAYPRRCCRRAFRAQLFHEVILSFPPTYQVVSILATVKGRLLLLNRRRLQPAVGRPSATSRQSPPTFLRPHAPTNSHAVSHTMFTACRPDVRLRFRQWHLTACRADAAGRFSCLSDTCLRNLPFLAVHPTHQKACRTICKQVPSRLHSRTAETHSMPVYNKVGLY